MNRLNLSLLKSFDKFIPNIIIFLFGLIPFFIPFSFQFFMPDFTLCVLYFWAVYAPEKVSIALMFIMGLLQDTHLGLPMGTLALASVALFMSSLSYHQYLAKKPFILSWLIFGFIVLVTSSFKMSFNVFALLRPLYTEKFIFEAILTIFSYPTIAALCFNTYQKFR
ncbi:MAG: rod shape-determining protein MreD [Janthinobacterium lividum]